MSNKRFTPDQLKRLSNILDNIGQVVLASIVIPTVLKLYDQPNPVVVWVGIFTMIMSWWFSLKLERISS